MGIKEKLNIIEDSGEIVQQGRVSEKKNGSKFITENTYITLNKEKNTITFTNKFKNGSKQRITVKLKDKKKNG